MSPHDAPAAPALPALVTVTPGRAKPWGTGHAMRRGEARVRLLRTTGRWLGVTYLADRAPVQAALRELVAAGEYPERLWDE